MNHPTQQQIDAAQEAVHKFNVQFRDRTKEEKTIITPSEVYRSISYILNSNNDATSPLYGTTPEMFLGHVLEQLANGSLRWEKDSEILTSQTDREFREMVEKYGIK